MDNIFNIFINSKDTKTFDPQKLVINPAERINLKT